MALDGESPGLLECVGVERAVEGEADLGEIGRFFRIVEAVEEHAGLGWREGIGVFEVGVGLPDDSFLILAEERFFYELFRARTLANNLGKLGQGGGGEELLGGKLEVVLGGEADDPDTEDGVATELEEIVVAADLLDAQSFGEDIGERLFDGSLRRLVGLG